MSVAEAPLYKLSKRVISQYIRTGCRRRLRLDLYAGVGDRRRADAPEKDARRPGLALLSRQGKEYERAKYRELEAIFPDLVVRGADKPSDASGDRAFDNINLEDHIDALQPNQFALEAQYQLTASFRTAHHLGDLEDGSAVADGQGLIFEGVRPDIIHVVSAPGSERRVITPSGRLERVAPSDTRLGLRIIDIKISGEASPAHFSELAYYGMVLAGWLRDTGREGRFVVLSEAAIWPGSHDGSTIYQLDREDRAQNEPRRNLTRYLEGLNADLETMPPEVVIGRITRFLSVDLREVLAERNWRTLPWHIDHKCAGCDYLGYRWSRHDDEGAETAPEPAEAEEPRYCWPMAECEGHLSRVAGITEGACGKLREFNIINVAAVSVLAAGSPAFERHQALRAKRTVLRERALVLQERRAATIADRAGTSAILPRFADIRVAVSADFDIGSGLTFAFGYRIEYGVPNASYPRGVDGPRYGRVFDEIERPLLVLERSLESEGETVRLWLDHLVADIHRLQGEILAGYRQHGAPDKKDVTIQFYLWDRLTFEHLSRVFGRHLDRLQAPTRMGQVDVSPMAWIFPADTVLDEPDFIGRSSPISIVSDAIASLMAAPIPHHYGVIDFANAMDPQSRVLANGNPWSFHVNKFYRDPLSDQIPSERGHEIWEHESPFPDQDFQGHQETVRRVVKRKLHAISYVAEKLTRDLRDTLTAEAPAVGSIFQGSDRLTGVGDDGQILYQHARLMAAAQRLEIDLLLAMPPHEREARFRSARVEAVLAGDARATALRTLRLEALIVNPRILVFRLSDRSKEARMKKGEYTWSFMPEADLPELQELTVAQFKKLNPTLEDINPIEHFDYRTKLRERMNVTIVEIDRGARLLAVQTSELVHEVLQLGLLQMDLDERRGRFAIIDPIATDYFTRKLKKALSDASGVRHPPLAQARPLFPSPGVAHVRPGRARGGQADSPAAEFIWNADQMAQAETAIPTAPVLEIAERAAPGLTHRQRDAITEAVQRRFSLWWGPPGTGKSRTAQAYITALAKNAADADRSLRIAITGFTWVAIDNIAKRLPAMLRTEGVFDQILLARLSSTENVDGVDVELRDFVLPMGDAQSDERIELERRLAEAIGVTIVASTVDQMFKLGGSAVCAPLFDVILIDEASQLDVGHAIVGLTKLADAGRVTVVGDDKQMAPIHPLEAPDGIEHLLGSVYDFYRHYREHEEVHVPIVPVMLNRSFRSNEEIVEFIREAGYGSDLEAAAANRNLRIATQAQYPVTQPPTWQAALPWSAHFGDILAANEPLVAIVHHDRFSSQRNDEEADLVAGLVLSLYNAGLMDLAATNTARLTPQDFFRRGLGIVTPHRAQQAAVYDRLASIMPAEVDRNDIFASIDTVERFQGQEKAVMVASFGLGDVDQIAAEEQFLYSLNRFNVAASRAQAKFIAVVSRQLVDYLPRDRTALEESRLLKHYVDGFLSRSQTIDLPGLGRCEMRLR